jgi:hypothetical protein
LYSGVVSSFIILLSIIFKTQHWPGAAILLTIGVALFSLVYVPLLFIDKQKYASTGIQKFSNICIVLAMFIIVVGFLFKSLHWPGAGIAIYLGHLVLIILIPTLYIRADKEKDALRKLNFYNEVVILVLLFALSLFLWLL